VLIPRPGFPVTGPERSAANAYLLDRGLPMDARLRHVYVAGDIALLIVTGPFAAPRRMAPRSISTARPRMSSVAALTALVR
jgi:hypothetical protein